MRLKMPVGERGTRGPEALNPSWLRVSWEKESGDFGVQVADVCDYFLAHVWIVSSVAKMSVIGSADVMWKVPFSQNQANGIIRSLEMVVQMVSYAQISVCRLSN